MKSSVSLALLSALLSSASPVRPALDKRDADNCDLNKRAVVTEMEVEVVTVTVTAGMEPPATTSTSPSSSPSLGAQFVEVPTTSAAPEPTKAPEPVYQPEPEPVPVPEPETTSSPPPPPPPSKTESTPEATGVPVSGPAPNEYAQELLDYHNVHRSNHSVPALAWDEELASWAAQTAKKCEMEHDKEPGDGDYGQNLAAVTDNRDKIDAALGGVTMQWYNDEYPKFAGKYGMENPQDGFKQWGHFTQLLWKGTERVGCFTEHCKAGTALSSTSWYTVCNYDPPGNFANEYDENVLEPTGDETVKVEA